MPPIAYFMAENKGKENMKFKISVMAIYFALGWGDVWGENYTRIVFYDTENFCNDDGDCGEDEWCAPFRDEGTPYPYEVDKFYYQDAIYNTGCCAKDLSTCPSGTGWSSWSNIGNGKYARTQTAVSIGSDGWCNVAYLLDIECAPGYYKEGKRGFYTCERCPSIGGVYGTSTIGNNWAQKSCYIPANTTMTEGSNQFYFSENCSYSCDGDEICEYGCVGSDC